MKKRCVIYTSSNSDKTNDSNDMQIANLYDFAEREGLEVFYIFEEQMTILSDDRPALQDCMNFLKFNSEFVLLISDISKLGSSVKVAVERIEKLTKKHTPVYIRNINLWTIFVDGSINPMAKIFLTALGMGAEMERKAILGKLNKGRERAKIMGVRMGRPTGTKMSGEDLLNKYPEVVKSLKKGFSIRYTANICSVSNSTVQRVKVSMTQQSSHTKNIA